LLTEAVLADAAGLGVVEIDEIEDLDDPLTGTAGIEYRVDERADRFALFLTLFLAEDFLTLFLTLRFADAFLAALFFAAT
jgi:hypothetical protein